MDAADAARISFDPGHGVGTGSNAGAYVELENDVVRRVGGNDLNWAFGPDRFELGSVIVIAGAEPGRVEIGGGLREQAGHFSPSVQISDWTRRGHHDVLGANGAVQVDCL